MRRLVRLDSPAVALRVVLGPLVAAAVACGDAGPATPAHIVITPNLPRVPADGTLPLTATVVDADGEAIEGQPVTFQSSDEDVLTVSQSGLLRSAGPLGTSIIHFASGEVTAEVEATVVLGPSTLIVTPDNLELVIGDRVPLTITVTDENGDVVAAPEVVFHTQFPEVVQVSLDGYVSAVGQGGSVIIVGAGGLFHQVQVFVSSP